MIGPIPSVYTNALDDSSPPGSGIRRSSIRRRCGHHPSLYHQWGSRQTRWLNVRSGSRTSLRFLLSWCSIATMGRAESADPFVIRHESQNHLWNPRVRNSRTGFRPTARRLRLRTQAASYFASRQGVRSIPLIFLAITNWGKHLEPILAGGAVSQSIGVSTRPAGNCESSGIGCQAASSDRTSRREAWLPTTENSNRRG